MQCEMKKDVATKKNLTAKKIFDVGMEKEFLFIYFGYSSVITYW